MKIKRRLQLQHEPVRKQTEIAELSISESRFIIIAKMLTRVKEFLDYWWYQYILLTSLYMLEPWERVLFSIL